MRPGLVLLLLCSFLSACAGGAGERAASDTTATPADVPAGSSRVEARITYLAVATGREGSLLRLVYSHGALEPASVDASVLMPGLRLDGLSMRGDPVLKHIPVVVLTSADDADTKLRALDLGASDFLRKPVDPSELALRLRNTLAAKAHREALRRTFVRYVSPRLADGIINDAAAPFAAHAQRADVVALFADLRSFTRITETIEVELVVDMLNEYFSVLTDAAYRNDGTIFNMAGDCLLVGFNVPFAQPDANERAWRTASAV